jgi:gamma-tubulin complex component 2
MSSNDRRSASHKVGGGTRPRVVSSSRDPEKLSRPSIEDNKSPRPAGNMENLRGSTSSGRGLHREASNTTERRTERNTVTTRDRVHVKTRNTVKESPNAGNRGDFDKSRTRRVDTGTPPAKKKEESTGERKHSLMFCRTDIPTQDANADHRAQQYHGILKLH